MSLTFIIGSSFHFKNINHPRKEEALERLLLVESRIRTTLSEWQENFPAEKERALDLRAVSEQEIRSLKTQKTALSIAVVTSVFFLFICGAIFLSSTVAYFFFPSPLLKGTFHLGMVGAGACCTLFSTIINTLLELNFSSKKRVLSNKKFHIFNGKFMISQGYHASLDQLMKEPIQRCYKDWKNEMKKIERFYLLG